MKYVKQKETIEEKAIREAKPGNKSNFLQICEYVNGRGSRKTQRVGVLLATREHQEKVIITCSKVNSNSEDIFDKEFAIELANNRYNAIIREERDNIAPRSFKKALEVFEVRCRRYFKTDDIDVPELTSLDDMHDCSKCLDYEIDLLRD